MAHKYADYGASAAQALSNISTNTVVATYSQGSTSLSAGDIIHTLKVPHGAKVVDGWVRTTNGNIDFDVGDDDNASRYAAVTSSSAVTTRLTAGFGYQYDISDDAADNARFGDIQVTVGTVNTVSLSGVVQMGLTYVMDDSDEV